MRLKTLLILCICPLLQLSAQKGLHVSPVFEGKVVKDMNEARLTGSAIEKYGLTSIHTLKFSTTAEQRNQIETLVNQDYENRDRDEEEVDREVIDGHVYYSIFRLDSRRTELSIGGDTGFRVYRQYLCYQCKKGKNKNYDITMVLLEGKSLTLDKLRKNFKSK